MGVYKTLAHLENVFRVQAPDELDGALPGADEARVLGQDLVEDVLSEYGNPKEVFDLLI